MSNYAKNFKYDYLKSRATSQRPSFDFLALVNRIKNRNVTLKRAPALARAGSWNILGFVLPNVNISSCNSAILSLSSSIRSGMLPSCRPPPCRAFSKLCNSCNTLHRSSCRASNWAMNNSLLSKFSGETVGSTVKKRWCELLWYSWRNKERNHPKLASL